MTVSHPSRADEVYQQLKRDIADFRLVPGDRITETEISEHCVPLTETASGLPPETLVCTPLTNTV